MPLREYICKKCQEVQFVFDDEHTNDLGCKSRSGKHKFILMPPRVSVVIATNTFMSDPQLDSWVTVYELDRQLNIEAREQKEIEIFQEVRRNL